MNGNISDFDRHIGQKLQQIAMTDQEKRKLIDVLGIDQQALLDLQAGRKRLHAEQMLNIAASFKLPISFFFDASHQN